MSQFLALFCLAGSVLGEIVEISVPVNSQSATSRPAYNNVWLVRTPPQTLQTSLGIGLIANPRVIGGANTYDFALHMDFLSVQPSYVGPYVPNPAFAVVTFEFDKKTTVKAVEIVQHANGVTRIEGFAGRSAQHLQSLGAVFGPAGDVLDAPIGAEASSQIFDFGNVTVSEKVFQLVVRKTNGVNAFALYRAYPLDEFGHRIKTAVSKHPAGDTVLERVSVPVASQSPFSRPAYDGTWSVQVPPYPFNVNLGVGIMQKPQVTNLGNDHEFSLHIDALSAQPSYLGPYVPNPAFSTVTFEFKKSQIVSGVEIVQHANGVTRVEGRFGDSVSSLQTLGSVWGPPGDVLDTYLGPEGVSHVFDFANATCTGTIFQFTVRKTNGINAFAAYRIYPLGPNGQRIPVAQTR